MALSFQAQPRCLQQSAFATPSLISRQLHLPIDNKLVRPKTCTRRKQYPICSQLVSLPTGVDMEVIQVPARQSKVGSSTERPPLIFVHGSLHAAWCFHLFQSYFASHGFSSYAVSLRGAGNTNAVLTANPTVDDHLSDLSALLRCLDLPVAPVIIGHSIGGFIVQKFAEQETSQPLAAMILMNSSPPSGNNKLIRRIMFQVGFWKTLRIAFGFVRRTVTKDISLCREMFFSPISMKWFSDDIEGDQKLLEYMELFKKTSKTLDVRSLKNVVRGTGCLKGKVFVIGGTADPLVDVTALEESASFWEGDLTILEDAPHDTMLYSKWEKTAALLLEWITKNVPCGQKTSSVPETLS